MNHRHHTILKMSLLLFVILLSFFLIFLGLRNPARADFIPQPNPPGFDAPDDPNYHCPQGYFFEGNWEKENGPGRCTLMTCQNNHWLPQCTSSENSQNSQQVPSTAGTQSCSYTVPDPPSLVPQGPPLTCPNTLTCWASVLTMMLSYRDHQSYTIDTVMKTIGQVYASMYNSNNGLDVAELIQIANKLGLTGLTASGTLTQDDIKDMLQTYGPIIIITAKNPRDLSTLHAQIIIGINEDCNSVDQSATELITLDPLDPNEGNPVTQDITALQTELGNGGIIMHLTR